MFCAKLGCFDVPTNLNKQHLHDKIHHIAGLYLGKERSGTVCREAPCFHLHPLHLFSACTCAHLPDPLHFGWSQMKRNLEGSHAKMHKQLRSKVHQYCDEA